MFSKSAQERARSILLQIPEPWEWAELVDLLLLIIQTMSIHFCVALLIALFDRTAYPTSIILTAGFCFHPSAIGTSFLSIILPLMSPVFRALQALCDIQEFLQITAAQLSFLTLKYDIM